MAEADLTFLYGESVPRCRHQIDKHFVGYYTLQYMSRGAVDLAIGAKEFPLKGKWFWSAWPGPRIQFQAAWGTGYWRHRYLAFRGPLVERWTRARLFPIEPQRPPGGVDYGHRFDALLARSARTDKWGVLRAIHQLEGILLELAEARASAEEVSERPWLDRSIERLSAGARSGELDYARVAADVGMAESTWRRRFRNAIGLPPHEFVLHARVAEARRLLGESDLPIKQIARELGYSDVYFFSRQFRKLTGAPPALYRKSRQE